VAVRGRADVQAAPDFAPGYEALARRRSRKIATSAVARKLLTRAYHLLSAAACPSDSKQGIPASTLIGWPGGCHPPGHPIRC
jgi:hypothetical protein